MYTYTPTATLQPASMALARTIQPARRMAGQTRPRLLYAMAIAVRLYPIAPRGKQVLPPRVVVEDRTVVRIPLITVLRYGLRTGSAPYRLSAERTEDPVYREKWSPVLQAYSGKANALPEKQRRFLRRVNETLAQYSRP